MINDPIVEEVRKVRQELFEQCGCDLKQFMHFIRKSQAKHGDRLITSLKKKRTVETQSTQVDAEK